MPKRCLVSLLLLFSLMSVLAVVAQDDFVPTYEAIEGCFTEVDIELDYECGYVTVPEFYDGRTDGVMRLAVYRIFATGDDATGSPIFFLDGGPGSPMTTYVSVNNANLNLNLTQPDSRGTPVLDMLENHDFVMMSQRGAAFSEPAALTCPEAEDAEYLAIVENLTKDEEAELTRSAIQSCVDERTAEGINFDAYDSYANADDVNAVREALGYDQIIYVGASYGAQLGQFVMQRHPDILEGVVLDGANALSKIEWEQDNGVVFEDALRRVLALCAADEHCSENYEDPEGLLDAAIEKVQSEPLILDYYSDAASQDVIFELTTARFANSLSHGLTHIPQFIPALLDATVNGSVEIVAEQDIESLKSAYNNDDFPVLMHLAIVCSDDPPQREISFDQSDESSFAIAIERASANWYATACEVLDVEPLPDGNDEDVSVDVPTLLLSGGFDTRTPPFRNQEVADNLPNARVVTFEWGTHVQYGSNRMCEASILQQFVSDPSALDSIDTSCVEAITLDTSIFGAFFTFEDLGMSSD